MNEEELKAFELKIREEERAKVILAKDKEIEEAKLKAAEEASKTEKEKLYSTLSKKDADAKALAIELEKYKKLEEDKKIQEENLLKSKMTAEEQLKAIAEENKKIIERAEKMALDLKATFDSELSKRDLEVYKQKIIAENSDEIIPDLVIGSTKEEIDQAVIRSKDRFKELAEKITKKTQTTQLSTGSLPQDRGNNKLNSGDTPSGDAKNVWDLKDKDFEEYTKNYLAGFAKK